MVGIRDQVVALAFDEALSIRLMAEEARQQAQAESARASGGHGIPPDQRYETKGDLVN